MNTDLVQKMVIDYNKSSFTEEEKKYMKFEADYIKSKYPYHVPILCRSDKFKLKKNKYLISCDLTFGQFVNSIRKKISELKPDEGLYFMIDNTMIPMTADISTLYNQYKNSETHLLHIDIAKESTFG